MKMNHLDGKMLYERCLVQTIFLIHEITISTHQQKVHQCYPPFYLSLSAFAIS